MWFWVGGVKRLNPNSVCGKKKWNIATNIAFKGQTQGKLFATKVSANMNDRTQVKKTIDWTIWHLKLNVSSRLWLEMAKRFPAAVPFKDSTVRHWLDLISYRCYPWRAAVIHHRVLRMEVATQLSELKQEIIHRRWTVLMSWINQGEKKEPRLEETLILVSSKLTISRKHEQQILQCIYTTLNSTGLYRV